jgi:hypothetical protein
LRLIQFNAGRALLCYKIGTSPGGDSHVTEQDRIYYRRRIAAEEAAAARAAHPLAAECHRRLAAEYANLMAANDSANRRESAA